MRGVPGLRGPGRMTRMASAICGSAKRAAPNRLIGRAELETQRDSRRYQTRQPTEPGSVGAIPCVLSRPFH